MFDKFLNIIDVLNSFFYGEYWFIPWGIIFLLFAFLVVKELPKLIKSFKENKERSKKVKNDILKLK